MRRFTLIALLVAIGCASPQEKATNRAMRDYRRASAGCAAHAREQVARLAAVARVFRAANNRWPVLLPELARFAYLNKLALDELAFNEITFASMSDGSLQIQYEVNCARFDPANQSLLQPGMLNVKPQ